MSRPAYGWAALTPGGEVDPDSVGRTRSEALGRFLDSTFWADGDAQERARAWRRMRREGWALVRVVTHTLSHDTAVASALATAQAGLEQADEDYRTLPTMGVAVGEDRRRRVTSALRRIRTARDADE